MDDWIFCGFNFSKYAESFHLMFMIDLRELRKRVLFCIWKVKRQTAF